MRIILKEQRSLRRREPIAPNILAETLKNTARWLLSQFISDQICLPHSKLDKQVIRNYYVPKMSVIDI